MSGGNMPGSRTPVSPVGPGPGPGPGHSVVSVGGNRSGVSSNMGKSGLIILQITLTINYNQRYLDTRHLVNYTIA